MLSVNVVVEPGMESAKPNGVPEVFLSRMNSSVVTSLFLQEMVMCLSSVACTLMMYGAFIPDTVKRRPDNKTRADNHPELEKPFDATMHPPCQCLILHRRLI